MAFIVEHRGPASTDNITPVICTIDGSPPFLVNHSVPAGSTDPVVFLEAAYPPGSKDRLRWAAAATSTDLPVPKPQPGWQRLVFVENDFEDVVKALAKEVFLELRAVGSTRNNASFVTAIRNRLAST